jgi:rubrerythrin
MPNFANPFQGNVERKLTKEELIQAIRLDIAGELEAIYVYDAHVQATDNVIAKKVIADIRDEEKVHVGELMTLLRILDPEEAEHFISGEEEVREMLEELGIEAGAGESAGAAGQQTVGSLLDE